MNSDIQLYLLGLLLLVGLLLALSHCASNSTKSDDIGRYESVNEGKAAPEPY